MRAVEANKQQPSSDVTLKLSYAEAVVLSDMLSRWERDGTQERLPFEDQAEQRVVWDLTAVFEPLIDEVFDASGYESVVSYSRWQVRDSNIR
jgi:hypothetical protein